MNPTLKAKLEAAARSHVKRIWGDEAREIEKGGTEIDFKAGAGWMEAELEAKCAALEQHLHSAEQGRADDIRQYEALIKALEAELKETTEERDLAENREIKAELKLVRAREIMKSMAEALEWYWGNWNANDQATKTKGYSVCAAPLAAYEKWEGGE